MKFLNTYPSFTIALDDGIGVEIGTVIVEVATSGVVTTGVEDVAPTTVITCVVVALFPKNPTVPFMRTVWTPISAPRGTHAKRPLELILSFPSELPANESLNEKALGLKSSADTAKEIVLPKTTRASDVSDGIISRGPAPTCTV